MDPALLARAAALGFTIAAAVGPISVLAIRRTLAHGRAYGLASGVGVALADASYAAIAAFGLTALTSVLVGSRLALGIVGGAVVAWLGARTLANPPPALASSEGGDRPGLAAAAASIYALTMANPMTILSFAALFAALGLTGTGGLEAATVTLGVFAGSAAWWIVLTAGLGWLRTRTTPGLLSWISRVSGLILVAFGLLSIAGALAHR